MDHFIAKYDANKLLLWAILAIASSHSMPQAYNALVDPVRHLAADLYGTQSRSLQTIQALLLLCAWPFPFQHSANDPSPMYCGLATNVAYQLGLHRSGFRQDFEFGKRTSPEGLDSERELAWAGCYIMNFT
jgi:hypothetical protein